MKRIILIPARLDSERFYGKVLHPICGRPMLEWVYRGALESRLCDKIYILSDNAQVIDVAENFGADCILTPQATSGTDRVAWAAFESLFLDPSDPTTIIVHLQADEPLISGSIIDTLFYGLCDEQGEKYSMASLFYWMEGAMDPNNHMNEHMSDLRSPDHVKVVMNIHNEALYFSRHPLVSRKDTSYCKHIGLYAYRLPLLKKLVNLPKSSLEDAENLEQLRALEHGVSIRLLRSPKLLISVDRKEDIIKVENILKTT